MEDQFAPYELAVKLKELGFNSTCLKKYYKRVKHSIYCRRKGEDINFEEGKPYLRDILSCELRRDLHVVELCPAPLWQQAFNFLLKDSDLCVRYWGDETGVIMNDEFDEVAYFNNRKECLEKLIELCQK